MLFRSSTALPANSFGRCNGVAFAKLQIPCKSGRQSVVRGAGVLVAGVLFAFAPGAVVWPACNAETRTIAAIAAPTAQAEVRFRLLISNPRSERDSSYGARTDYNPNVACSGFYFDLRRGSRWPDDPRDQDAEQVQSKDRKSVV